MDCSILTLYGCVPPSGSLAARVCAMSPLFFSLILPFKQHPSPDRLCIVLVWSGLVQIQSQSRQSRVFFVVECWSVTGGQLACFLSVPEVSWQKRSSTQSDSCLKEGNWSNQKKNIHSNKARMHPTVQRANGSSSCTVCYFLFVTEVKRGYCGWPPPLQTSLKWRRGVISFRECSVTILSLLLYCRKCYD